MPIEVLDGLDCHVAMHSISGGGHDGFKGDRVIPFATLLLVKNDDETLVWPDFYDDMFLSLICDMSAS